MHALQSDDQTQLRPAHCWRPAALPTRDEVMAMEFAFYDVDSKVVGFKG